MSDAAYIELPAPPKKKRARFFRTWRGMVILVFIGLAICAGIFSWWLSEGRVSSLQARVDAVVCTVGPDFPTQMDRIFVSPGDVVVAGQPLGSIDIAALDSKNPESAEAAGLQPMNDVYGRLNDVKSAEKGIASKVEQARATEAQARKIWQDSVTAHVRAQLAMRSIDRRDYAAYEQASQAEYAARMQMENARAQFEQISRMRAVQDQALVKVRSEILRSRQRSASPVPAQIPASASPHPADNTLYAPVPGKVLSVNAVPGQPLMQGDPVFLILPSSSAASDERWVQAWFSLKDEGKIKTGQKVSIKLPDNGLLATGKVSAVPSSAEIMQYRQNGGGNTFPVRIDFDDPAEAATFTPGSRAECQIQTRYLLGYDFFR